MDERDEQFHLHIFFAYGYLQIYNAPESYELEAHTSTLKTERDTEFGRIRRTYYYCNDNKLTIEVVCVWGEGGGGER